MASLSRKGRFLPRCADSRTLLVLFIFLLFGRKVRSEPASCGSALDNGGLGSGVLINSICGVNSECSNNAKCQCDRSYFTPSGNHTDCQSTLVPDSRCSRFDDDCIFCGSTFSGPCQGCVNVIYNDQCLRQCPDNTNLEIFNNVMVDLVIRSCEGSGTTNLPEWAIIVITVMGAVLLVIVAVLITAMACAFLRRSSIGQLDIAERTEKFEQEEVDSGESGESITNSGTRNDFSSGGVMEDYFESDAGKLSDEEGDEFCSKLAVLRTQAETFLKMLNDMRRRLKELPPSSPSIQQYKDVMRDLTRLLYLLNKKPETIRIPPDGISLLDWSEQILNRYLNAQGKPGINIRTSTTIPSAATNPNRISIIGDQATTHF